MKLQSFLENAGKYMCLAADYIYAVADYLGADEKAAYALIIQTLLDTYDTEVMDKDFFVQNPIKLMSRAAELAGFPNLKFSVTKQDISKYSDLPNGYAAVRHDYNGKSHFVLAKDKFRIWDSLDDSVCVKNGKPTTARIITIKQ